jgi:hypothetical protein
MVASLMISVVLVGVVVAEIDVTGDDVDVGDDSGGRDVGAPDDKVETTVARRLDRRVEEDILSRKNLPTNCLDKSSLLFKTTLDNQIFTLFYEMC